MEREIIRNDVCKAVAELIAAEADKENMNVMELLYVCNYLQILAVKMVER